MKLLEDMTPTDADREAARVAAKLWADTVPVAFGRDKPFARDCYDAGLLAGILHERERAAKVAEARARQAAGDIAGDPHLVARDACFEVAAAIRKGA